MQHPVPITLTVQEEAGYSVQLPEACCFLCSHGRQGDSFGEWMVTYCTKLDGHVHDNGLCRHYLGPRPGRHQ